MNKQDARQFAEEPQDEQEEQEKEKRFSERVTGGGAVQKEQAERKRLMKEFRRAKHIPAAEEVERFEPSPEKELTSEQVELRFSQF